MIGKSMWLALVVGDGVLAPDGTWHRVTRVEGGWIELDGTHAFPVPAGRVTAWDSRKLDGTHALPVPADRVTAWDSRMAGAVGVVAAHLGGVEVEHAE